MIRVGLGYDVHRLVENRRLVLGGVEVPFSMGLLGHSDADALLHAVSDAVLGAAGLGDIGRHFPDTDPRFKDLSSLVILRHVQELVARGGCSCVNVDAVIIAQKPRLSPYIEAMEQNIARGLGITPDAVNVKATTTEGLGFEGAGAGIAAQAVVLVMRQH